ncbi:hypothetical protein P3X46_034275 [Hevea brasiliensis]|uniref:RNase H type-1 domain-containing protein n=1 Tax=Hevea brasiliensis TaxID=3981 RepID=A0ABQ9KA53_HEVBR|nr:hypothetical protein P3X46_034275 [Hevea brasiliensis]
MLIENQLIWHHTKTGNPTVRAIYHYLKRNQSVLSTYELPSSSRVSDPSFWKRLWGLKVSPKIRNFLWRVCNYFLATRLNLFRRKCSSFPICSLCYGIIARNSQGSLLDGCLTVFICSSPLFAEGIAMRVAFLFAISRGFQQCWIESDSKQICQLLLNPTSPTPWVLQAIIHDISVLLSANQNFKVIHNNRANNRCADWIAVSIRKGYLVSGWI